ncbi:MAG: hypothetical protein H6736_17225 [Alphaproteobacteria bacterium]|nr:hypothetical protein [Alphaproteobacteria bacterium]
MDVPIPPACGLPLDDILFERSDNRAALHVGALRNAYYDWDCDGIGDYIGLDDRNESGGGEDIPPQAPDLWVGECGPPEYLESDCLFIDEMLRDPAMFGFEDVTGDGTIADEMFPPEWLDCLYEVCPDLVDALRTPNPIPMAP